MDELGMATSALAAVAIPLVGLGPLLRRLLGPWGCVVAGAVLAGIVYGLTGLWWATTFTACLGVAPALSGRLRLRERLAVASRVASERRSAWR
jgi:hypothetical protein